MAISTDYLVGSGICRKAPMPRQGTIPQCVAERKVNDNAGRGGR